MANFEIRTRVKFIHESDFILICVPCCGAHDQLVLKRLNQPLCKMKLLLVSDLHSDQTKLSFLSEMAASYDAVIIAGDLIDQFSSDPRVVQTARIHRWVRSLRSKDVTLAWCSGNHDFMRPASQHPRLPSPAWMHDLPANTQILSDCQSGVLELAGSRLVVSTLPWPVAGHEVYLGGYCTSYHRYCERILAEGARLRDETGGKWLMVVHSPPSETILGSLEEASDLVRSWVNRFQPDFSSHGHLHDGPLKNGGRWIARCGKTVSLNAGQAPNGEMPLFIGLSIEKNHCATWCDGFENRETRKLLMNGQPLPIDRRAMTASERHDMMSRLEGAPKKLWKAYPFLASDILKSLKNRNYQKKHGVLEAGDEKLYEIFVTTPPWTWQKMAGRAGHLLVDASTLHYMDFQLDRMN